MQSAEAFDLIDTLLNLKPDSKTWQARQFREKVKNGTQASYAALFSSDLSLPLQDRWLVALYASSLMNSPELTAHYTEQALLAGIDEKLVQIVTEDHVEDIVKCELNSVLQFTKKLILDPIEGNEEALLTLKKSGMSTQDVVVLGQLIGFLAYQIRLVAGLKAMQKLEQAA
ncbi:MAG: CMD domain-containing protein [Advenella sp.]